MPRASLKLRARREAPQAIHALRVPGMFTYRDDPKDQAPGPERLLQNQPPFFVAYAEVLVHAPRVAPRPDASCPEEMTRKLRMEGGLGRGRKTTSGQPVEVEMELPISSPSRMLAAGTGSPGKPTEGLMGIIT